MAVQQRRNSKRKKNKSDRTHYKAGCADTGEVPACGEYKLAHKMCECGEYNGRTVVEK